MIAVQHSPNSRERLIVLLRVFKRQEAGGWAWPNGVNEVKYLGHSPGAGAEIEMAGEMLAKRVRLDGPRKVAVIGAAGGIGQPLSLLLKLNPLVSELSLYDIVAVEGVGADLSHIPTPAKVAAYIGAEQIDAALQGCEIVVVVAGRPQKPGEPRDALFNTNVAIMRSIAEACIKNCPNAMLCIVTNPVNALVPFASQLYQSAGCYEPRRIFGITTLDVIRSSTFVGELKGLDPRDVSVAVIGGHSGKTILPVLSQTTPSTELSAEEVVELTGKIQNAANVVIEKKAGRGSAVLATAFATERFVSRLLQAMNGASDVVECCYVKSDLTDTAYFASPAALGVSTEQGGGTTFLVG